MPVKKQRQEQSAQTSQQQQPPTPMTNMYPHLPRGLTITETSAMKRLPFPAPMVQPTSKEVRSRILHKAHPADSSYLRNLLHMLSQLALF